MSDSIAEKYGFTEKQNLVLSRIIDVIPQLHQYLYDSNSTTFIDGLNDFELQNQALLSSSDKTNLLILKRKYQSLTQDQTKESGLEFCLENIASWHPQPLWAELFTLEELVELNTMISRISGLHEFLLRHPNYADLTELITIYRKQIFPNGTSDYPSSYSLRAIEEKYLNLQETKNYALHYVNPYNSVSDYGLLVKFHRDSKVFLNADHEADRNDKILIEYSKTHHPFINSILSIRYTDSGHTDISLNLILDTLCNIYSPCNSYWNNEQAMIGCATALNDFANILGEQGISTIDSQYERFKVDLLELAYLYCSRVIYWNDKRTNEGSHYDSSVKEETYSLYDRLLKSYEDFRDYGKGKLGILLETRIHFRTIRKQLLETHQECFKHLLPPQEIAMMCMSDMKSNAKDACRNNMLGPDSFFNKEYTDIFQKNRLFDYSYSPESAAEKGKEIHERISYNIYKRYKDGYYHRTNAQINEIHDLAMNLLSQRNTKNHKTLHSNDATYFNEPKLKIDAKEIQQYLVDNGIEYFYHFTRKSAINSIIEHQGLMSHRASIEEGIKIPKSKSATLSRDKDSNLHLEDYVRLSFCKNLPLLHQRFTEWDEDVALLKISTEVASLADTLFCDREGTDPQQNTGGSLRDLKKVRIDVTKRRDCNESDPLYTFYQAEILVKRKIALKYIKNIDFPEILRL